MTSVEGPKPATARGTHARRGGWWLVVAVLLVTAALILRATSGEVLPDELWLKGEALSREGPDGPADDALDFSLFGPDFGSDVGAGHPENCVVIGRPGKLLRALAKLGLEIDEPEAVYFMTGEVRRGADVEDWPRAVRFVRADCWTVEQDHHARLADRLRDVAAGRATTAELRSTLDTTGWSPCRAVARVWQDAAAPFDHLAQGALAEAAVEAIGDRLSEADRPAIEDLIHADGRFVGLAADTQPEWMRSIVLTYAEGAPTNDALRSLWSHWWTSERVRHHLLMRRWEQPFAETCAVIDAVPAAARTTVSKDLDHRRVRDVNTQESIRTAGVGLRIGDPSWFRTLGLLIEDAHTDLDDDDPAIEAASAEVLRWVLDDAFAARLLAGTDPDATTLDARRERWREIGDALRNKGAGWRFDQETHRWGDGTAPGDRPR